MIVDWFRKAGLVTLAFCGMTASPACATIVFSLDGIGGVFVNDSITSDIFTDTYRFSVGTGPMSVALSSIKLHPQDADFLSVTLNGVAFSPASPDRAEAEAKFARPVSSGTQTLAVSGTAAGKPSYSGTIAFLALAEPSTWTMMIIGLGSIGLAVRSRGRRGGRLVSA